MHAVANDLKQTNTFTHQLRISLTLTSQSIHELVAIERSSFVVGADHTPSLQSQKFHPLLLTRHPSLPPSHATNLPLEGCMTFLKASHSIRPKDS